MGTKCVRQLAAFVVVFACCVAVAEPKRKHTGGQASSAHPEIEVAELPPVDASKCQELAEKLKEFKADEKTLKDGPRITLCSEAGCMRLNDKFRTYKSTFTLHADLKEKTIELRHVKEADKEAETSKVTYSFFVNSGEDTEQLLACFGNKPLKGTVVVQSFVKVPGEEDAHLKFRANVLNLEVVPPVTGKM